MLVFDVELLEIKRPPPGRPPSAPHRWSARCPAVTHGRRIGCRTPMPHPESDSGRGRRRVGLARGDDRAVRGRPHQRDVRGARSGEIVAALQRLHPVFGAEVNLDLDAVTTHVAARGHGDAALAPHARDGAPWVEHDGHVWRALTWVEGEIVHAVPDSRGPQPAASSSAGSTRGRGLRLRLSVRARRRARHRARTSRKLRGLASPPAASRATPRDRESRRARSCGGGCAAGDAGAAAPPRPRRSQDLERDLSARLAAARVCARRSRHARQGHARVRARRRDALVVQSARRRRRRRARSSSPIFAAAIARRFASRRSRYDRRPSAPRSSSGSRPCASSSPRGSRSTRSRTRISAGTRRDFRRGARTTSCARAASSRSASRCARCAAEVLDVVLAGARADAARPELDAWRGRCPGSSASRSRRGECGAGRRAADVARLAARDRSRAASPDADCWPSPNVTQKSSIWTGALARRCESPGTRRRMQPADAFMHGLSRALHPAIAEQLVPSGAGDADDTSRDPDDSGEQK